MPAVVAVIAMAISAVAGPTVAIWATVVAMHAVNIAIFAGIGRAIQKRQMKKLAAASAGLDQGRTVMVRDPIAPRRKIYGQIPVSGPIPFMHTGGTNNEYLYFVVTLAAHECEELGTVKFDGVEVPLDGSGNATGTFAGYAQVRKFTGLAAGERDTTWESELSGIWTANHLGKNIARLHVRLKHNPDLFVTGLPVVTCMTKGKKILDTRTSTTAWSANNALCAADHLMDQQLGKGVALARIDTDALNAAANVCDEDVTLADLSTEKRYTCNGAVTADQDPLDVLLDLRESMAGHISDCGGKWVIHAGAWRTPTLTLTDADMCGPFRMVPRLSRSDNFNGVRGLYFAPENQWAPADFPAVKNDTYMGWDGGKRLWKDVAYNFCTSPARAQRLAKIDLERGRQQIVFSADYMLKAMQCRPGDVIMVTRARQGWSAKYFEVDEWRLVIEGDDQGQPVMKIGLAVRETAEAVYDWNDGEETTVDLAPNTTLLDARTVATPAGLTLSTSNFLQPDGTITPRLRVQWTAAAAVQVSNGGAVRIEYKKASSSDWLEWSRIRGDLAEDYITDVEAGIGYNVRLQFISVFGVRGAYASASATVGADASAPATPTGLTATAGTGKAVALDWGDNTDDDLAGYKIYRNTTNNAGTATYIASVSASAFVDATVAVSTTYYYFISAYDRTGNESAKTSGVSVTTAPVVGAMTVALSTTYLSAGGSNGSTINTATMSATPSGGTGSGYTYQWTRTSGSTAIEPTQSTSRFTAFVASGGTDEVFNATFKCTVTDSASNTADSFENVSVDITFGTPP